MFKRKAYDKLLEWKKEFNGSYACFLMGAKYTGKTTIALEFARNEYESYILIDFSLASRQVLELFDDLNHLDNFFMMLQLEYDTELYERKSVIIFDEVQLFPKARQAIKHLVKDGRYDYIETGSLISIKKNVANILIPSEEHRINVYPMDYEEFLWATGGNPRILETAYLNKKPVGNQLNRNLMKQFRIYMAVGGMPQAVTKYIETNNLTKVDKQKWEILELYFEDLKKIDSTGRIGDMFKSVPSQLATKKKHYVISAATGKKKTRKDEERLFELIDSCLVLPCYNVTDPGVSLAQTRDIDCFKLYLLDVGLFVTMLFNDRENGVEDIYRKLLRDSLDAKLGYLYENVVAQAIKADGRDLYYHTWKKEDSTHSFEIDFLLTVRNKLVPVEVKSASVISHKSLVAFNERYSKRILDSYIFSGKDVDLKEGIRYKPFYMFNSFLRNIK